MKEAFLLTAFMFGNFYNPAANAADGSQICPATLNSDQIKKMVSYGNLNINDINFEVAVRKHFISTLPQPIGQQPAHYPMLKKHGKDHTGYYFCQYIYKTDKGQDSSVVLKEKVNTTSRNGALRFLHLDEKATLADAEKSYNKLLQVYRSPEDQAHLKNAYNQLKYFYKLK